MISIYTVQKCQLTEDFYSGSWLIKLIEKMTPEEVDLFCKEIAHLNLHYQTTIGFYQTYFDSAILGREELFWKIGEIDFDAPVTFKKL